MDEQYGRLYVELYRRHWWWRSREAIILNELRKLRLPQGQKILDVGCGDGLLFPKLSEFGEPYGIEVDTRLLTDSPHRARIYTELLGSPLYSGMHFNLIVALDVVEHIADDCLVMKQMADMLNPGGAMLVTTPAFQSLWDEHDVINKHYRRYTTATLRAIVPESLEVQNVRYLFPCLYPLKRAIAVLNAGKTKKIAQHAIPGRFFNTAMRHWCLFEYRFLSWLQLPLGTSVMLIARKR